MMSVSIKISKIYNLIYKLNKVKNSKK